MNSVALTTPAITQTLFATVSLEKPHNPRPEVLVGLQSPSRGRTSTTPTQMSGWPLQKLKLGQQNR